MTLPHTDAPQALSAMTWTQVARRRGVPTVLAIPLGSTEQHGPHLPLTTDTHLAVELCAGLARADASVVVAPALAYGASGEHQQFPGTLSIGAEALELVLVELGRSATRSFERVVFVCGHGGNLHALRRAEQRLASEGRAVLGFMPHWDGDAHAGHSETSLMLALEPGAVDVDAAVEGNTAPLAELLPRLMAEGVGAVSPSGVLGDPTEASADHGRALLGQLVAQLREAVARWVREPAP